MQRTPDGGHVVRLGDQERVTPGHGAQEDDHPEARRVVVRELGPVEVGGQGPFAHVLEILGQGEGLEAFEPRIGPVDQPRQVAIEQGAEALGADARAVVRHDSAQGVRRVEQHQQDARRRIGRAPHRGHGGQRDRPPLRVLEHVGERSLAGAGLAQGRREDVAPGAQVRAELPEEGAVRPQGGDAVVAVALADPMDHGALGRGLSALAEQQRAHLGLLAGQEARMREQAIQVGFELGAGVPGGDHHALAGLALELLAGVGGVEQGERQQREGRDQEEEDHQRALERPIVRVEGEPRQQSHVEHTPERRNTKLRLARKVLDRNVRTDGRPRHALGLRLRTSVSPDAGRDRPLGSRQKRSWRTPGRSSRSSRVT
ncbi:hypothetical protein D3C86_1083530 [compost metagenome]